jgi:hypothetical protein
MFEWLEKELLAVKTPQFHSIDGPASPELREAVAGARVAVPSAYRQFVLKFGNAKLYRTSRTGYRIGVFAGPREATLADGSLIYHIGWHDGASVYLKPRSTSDEFPIFEFEEETENRVASDFEDWLKKACAHARHAYGEKKWAAIVEGPIPFTHEEEDMLETRRLVSWKVLGVDANGKHRFEVINNGQHVMPVLTVGVRSRDGALNGAVCLDLNSVGPGQRGVLHVSCYKDLVPPQEIEIFELPEPRPEDREYYWEFDALQGHSRS